MLIDDGYLLITLSTEVEGQNIQIKASVDPENDEEACLFLTKNFPISADFSITLSKYGSLLILKNDWTKLQINHSIPKIYPQNIEVKKKLFSISKIIFDKEHSQLSLFSRNIKVNFFVKKGGFELIYDNCHLINHVGIIIDRCVILDYLDNLDGLNVSDYMNDNYNSDEIEEERPSKKLKIQNKEPKLNFMSKEKLLENTPKNFALAELDDIFEDKAQNLNISNL